ncbi:DUF6119 family protein [Acetobacter estunensis]|uniref:DUF6119 family protein n=1 Tax=Acetobacter estunensis TaxID=104097 RepID=UPI001C2D8932|nr:DUF6119 family protein [Acetobacter estunensis]MBV1836842.1 TIGR04141 family sporadically distributed protein [Acetobacter estunensis]
MTENIQKLSIRLLKDGIEPDDALREGVDLRDWQRIEGAKIALDTMGGTPPKWAGFLNLSDDEKKKVWNNTAYGLVFLNTSGRWFAVSFGMGHVKLDPAKFEQDFGLRVVLNSVDEAQLKSADVRTPDENTLSRRSQTSRGSDQSAFAIDVERDIIRGLAGTPKEKDFATRVAGSDALSMDRRLKVTDLPKACDDALTMYAKDDYKQHFNWVDQIKHVRQADLIKKLDKVAALKLEAVIGGADPDGLHLAFPIIYDPEKGASIRYKGFRSKLIFSDLDLSGYLNALYDQEVTSFDADDLKKHSVHEVDEYGNDCGKSWKINECLVLEAEVDGHTYVLSGGRWYQVAHDFATQLVKFFDNLKKEELPDALPDENEEKYNSRLKASEVDLLCLDRRLIKPTGWVTTMEACDFLDKKSRIIHVKDKTSSSRLSHLFNQGIVSSRVLIVDGAARDLIRGKINEVQTETGQTDFVDIIPGDGGSFQSRNYTIVYAVIGTGNEPKLPFFSLVTLRQAIRELTALGYQAAFSWIKKPASVGVKAVKSADSEQDEKAVIDKDGETI